MRLPTGNPLRESYSIRAIKEQVNLDLLTRLQIFITRVVMVPLISAGQPDLSPGSLAAE